MKKLLYSIPLVFLAFSMTGCLDDDDPETNYAEWKSRNDEYVTRMEALSENGEKVYTKVVPDWAPGNSVLIKWHNDRTLTQGNLSPLSNSTINIKYEMEDIDGKALGNSYSAADSVYQSRPNNNIIGMWAAMTQMHVGDSVTMVIPWASAYGVAGRGSILPFSTLIYHVKLKEIVKYELP